jgi:capping protein beta
MSSDKTDPSLTAALNLMRRMPPSSIENSLAGLIDLVPDLTEDLLNNVDQPLKLAKDTKLNRDFVLCDYNRDGDSFRSPWSNAYYPTSDEGFTPTPQLRKMEVEANDLFDIYRKMYFETGTSSVYFFVTDKEESKSSSFGSCWLIHKVVESQKNSLENGWWNSIHVFDVSEASKKGQYEYKLTTTVMVSMGLKNANTVGDVDLSGSMTQQETKTLTVDNNNSHIMNMGGMLESNEFKIRNTIENIYIQKTREVLNGVRLLSAEKTKAWDAINKSLQDAVLSHGKTRKVDSDKDS